jgi:hypothetical protein
MSENTDYWLIYVTCGSRREVFAAALFMVGSGEAGTIVYRCQQEDASMHAELIQIRAQVSATLGAIDRLLAANPESGSRDVLRYRASPGGMLSQEGVDEMYHRFRLGEPDAVIARAMGFSVQAVQKRRAIWKNPEAAGYKGRFHSNPDVGAEAAS